MGDGEHGAALYYFNPIRIIDEVKKRPGLYKGDYPADRNEKLSLWKEVGAAIFEDWDTCNKAQAYDRVLQVQRKWRSLRDAYNRELRARRTGVRVNRRVYMYFKKMSFLGGFEGSVSEEDEDSTVNHGPDPLLIGAVLMKKTKKESRKRRNKQETSDSEPPAEEVEMPVFPAEVLGDDTDSDKLFLMSFLPEIRQLPPNIKMWVRAQIAKVMQEAVTCQYENTNPGSSDIEKNGFTAIKIQRRESSD